MTFEEQFPEATGVYEFTPMEKKFLLKYCKSKQRVKEAIKHSRVGIKHGGCEFICECELLKELGLED